MIRYDVVCSGNTDIPTLLIIWYIGGKQYMWSFEKINETDKL